MFLGSLLFVVITSWCIFLNADTDVGIESWTKSRTTLPQATHFQFLAHSDVYYPECIFVFGGTTCGLCFYCYNITSDSIYSFATLDTGGNEETAANAVMIDEIIYFIPIGGDLQQFNILTKEESTRRTIAGAAQPCMVKHPNEDILYIVNGNLNNGFWIYNLSSSQLITASDLHVVRQDPACAVNDYIDDKPYFYVIGGNTATIERINLDNVNNDNNTQWEVLVTQLSSNIDDLCDFPYQTYVQSSHSSVFI